MNSGYSPLFRGIPDRVPARDLDPPSESDYGGPSATLLQLRELLAATPFVPFQVRPRDGGVFLVSSPAEAILRTDNLEVPDFEGTIWLADIAAIEPAERKERT